ncbi:Rpn family recombination-promoting nuclease/putative transposase [Faecalicatena contorta]|uniref:Rpn family recombination-promoting nuclease/putative transposase n=1 Tax=Faecalicatena contorta TaxID=39482 RepID=UPI001F2370B1|nr:Rpn family recombination-promoting nuclease/putative transposase [Faecalicatena contorta]MCF2682345.1 PD-(D/E)XK nuclease family transposase [Faecalicatena contorta]
MQNNLKEHFPIIRDRSEILDLIQHSSPLSSVFYSWKTEDQERFLDYCTGVRGLKLLYDSFFKALFNPDVSKERLEYLLFLILNIPINILKVLPNESARISAESSLLIMDIVVELEDGSIANIEMQKIGYAFTGQRSACYSADLLLRQYKRIKKQKGKSFHYKDIHKVFTIVFFEKSTSEFHQFPDTFIHHFTQQSDSGLHLDLLQEYIFIPLDIFRNIFNNKNILTTSNLEAWLAFLSIDDPDTILNLIQVYPYFEQLYREAYELCLDLERMMNMFSKELLQLDKNTVQYMIDEMQDQISELQETIRQQNISLLEKDTALHEKDSFILSLQSENKRLKSRRL